MELDREEKSISAEETFATDLRAPADLTAKLKALADRTAARLRARDVLDGQKITVERHERVSRFSVHYVIVARKDG